MRRAASYLVAALLLSTVSPAWADEPTHTQSFELVPGWNAIYLHLRPQDTDPAVVFAGLPVVSVWTRAFETGGPEFIQNPEEVLRPELKPPGWLVYIPADQPDAFLSTLESVEGNRGFLVHLGGAAPDFEVTGRPLVPIINWQPNAFNLVGFPVDEVNPPTFDSYFGPSPAHRGQPVFELLPTGRWQRIAVPDVEEMRYGEAYQVYSGQGSSFIAPLAVDAPTTDGLAYARGVTEHTVRITNMSDEPVTVEIQDLGEPDTVPLSIFHIRTDPPVDPTDPPVGTFEWPQLPNPYTVEIGAGTVRSVRLSVRRGDFPPGKEQLGTVVSVRSNGTQWLLPLTADKMDTTSPGLEDQSALSGLWVGNAIVNKVSQPNISPPGMEPVASVPGENVCQGGANVGNACAGDANCPVLCSSNPPKRCAGGVNAGLLCAPARCDGGTNDGGACDAANNDCPNGDCDVRFRCANDRQIPCSIETADIDCPGSECQGRLLCSGDSLFIPCREHDCPAGSCETDCPGSKCGDLMDRCKGGPREGGLCSASDGNDCPNGACGEVLRCVDDPEVECTPENAAAVCPGSTCSPIRLCTGGDNVGDACDVHDCPAGACAPPDDTCLGGARAGQSCVTDKDCPDSRCNAVSRCIGGPENARACASDDDCGASSCAPPSGHASEFPLRLILHVDGSGKVNFLKQVIQMWQAGTTMRDAADGTRILDQSGHLVLLTDDELIPSFQGATLRDGVPVGRRLSTAAFDFPGNQLAMSGAFGCGAGELTTTIDLERNFPTNPYRHPYHPDHDNLSGGGASTICRGGSNGGAPCQASADCPGGSCEDVEEAFHITRAITLDFAPTAGGDTRRPESCVDEIQGEYRETISGLHRNDVHVAGTFRLERVALTPVLNPMPK